MLQMHGIRAESPTEPRPPVRQERWVLLNSSHTINSNPNFLFVYRNDMSGYQRTETSSIASWVMLSVMCLFILVSEQTDDVILFP